MASDPRTVAVAWLLLALTLGLTLGLTEACSGPDVVLANLPSEASPPAGPDAAMPLRCASGTECPSGAFCDKTSCDADAGTCEPVPTFCRNFEQPVCGCDGITYLDDCLRKAKGVASSTPLSCPLYSALTCGGASGETCPTGSACGLLVRGGPGACPEAIGTCWALPTSCPPHAAGDMQWNACEPGPRCVDTCAAIKFGGVFERAATCP
jgi:hypothetical protein